MFTRDSLFNSNELLSMRVLPSLRNTYEEGYENNNDWFTTTKVSGGGTELKTFRS